MIVQSQEQLTYGLSQGKEQSMNWWQRLKSNPLASILLLLVFYVAVIAADFVAPTILMTLR